MIIYYKSSYEERDILVFFNSYNVPHPDGGLIAAHTVDRQPGGQVQEALENLFIQLQVGELALPLQRAQVDLVRRQVLSKPRKRRNAALRLGIFIETDSWQSSRPAKQTPTVWLGALDRNRSRCHSTERYVSLCFV